MTLKAETSIQIQTVIQADPALQVQLKSCTDANSAGTLIVNAAANQGIALYKEDLVAYNEASSPLQAAAISDDELDFVAGGSIPAWQQENEDLARRQAENRRHAYESKRAYRKK